MRIYSDITPTPDGAGTFSIYVVPEEDDLPADAPQKVTVGRPGATIALDREGFGKAPHPDLYGLLALLVFGPFSRRRFLLDEPVSEAFAEAVRVHLKREIGPTSADIEPRAVPVDGRDAVAFSGGIDSCAAFLLTPGRPLAIFLDRLTLRTGKRTMYSAAAARASCAALAAEGHEVKLVPSSTEHARQPVGFCYDWSAAAPAVVNADQFRLRSIAFGMILESAYFLGHSQYSDLAKRSIYKTWAPVFEAVGLPISLPTAGLSEVVTSRMAVEVFPQWLPQSCVRGLADTPCGSCFKCFRKQIMDARIRGVALRPNQLDAAMRTREVTRRMLEQPIHHEDGLAYSLADLEYQHPVFEALQQKTGIMRQRYGGLDFLDRHYGPSLELVPEFLRDGFWSRVSAHVEPMTQTEIELVESWNLSEIVEDPAYQEAQRSLLALTSSAPVAS